MGSLLAYEGDSGATLGSLRHHFLACAGDFGVTLESLFVYDVDSVATLGSLGGRFWHLRAAVGAFWVTLGLLREHLRHMGVPLGSL